MAQDTKWERWLLTLVFMVLAAWAWGKKAPPVDPFDELGEMAHQIDLDAADGNLGAQELSYSDPAQTHSQLKLWTTAKGVPRKYLVEHSAGGELLTVAYYYDPTGSLRYFVHTSSKAFSPLGAVAFKAQEVFQQSLALDARGELQKVVYVRTIEQEGQGPERQQAGVLPWPDESRWPVNFARDPVGELKRAGAEAAAKRPAAELLRAELSPPQLLKLMAISQDLQVVDVRTAKEFDEGHLSGAQLLPLASLADHWMDLDRAKPLVVYCHSGKRSAKALKLLKEKGFEKAQALRGGILAWKAEGYDLEY